MDRAKLKDSVTKAINTVMNASYAELQEEQQIIIELNIESIRFVDVIFEIEKELKIEFDMNLLALSLAKSSNTQFRNLRLSDLLDFILVTIRKK